MEGGLKEKGEKRKKKWREDKEGSRWIKGLDSISCTAFQFLDLDSCAKLRPN